MSGLWAGFSRTSLCHLLQPLFPTAFILVRLKLAGGLNELPMRRYRLFLVDAHGEVKEEFAFTASSDAQAKEVTAKWRADRPAELWTTHRRLARWN